MAREWNQAPEFIMLSLYDDKTYNVDFFRKREDAESWAKDEMRHNDNPDFRKVNVIIYEPVKQS